ncbi:MAG TPA: hypothetical protein VLF66_08460 [Thermoanaerobaculia bacterium]|jgi:hypothetical protein|nr:hypothetical protein [Thermoanaerobaculia bacterium]
MGATPREREAGDGALHNMSAPPRMTITIRPLGGPGPAPASAGEPAVHPGVRCFAHVDLSTLCPLPEEGAEGNGARGRLRSLVALAHRALGREESDPAEIARWTQERLEDELRERAARLDPLALGLPAFALVRRSPGRAGKAPAEGDPGRALALVTRVSGKVFVGTRSPLVAHLATDAAGFWFYAPWPVADGRPS